MTVKSDHESLTFRFQYSQEVTRISMDVLIDHVEHFLETYGIPALIATPFASVLDEKKGRDRFASLLRMVDMEDAPESFFKALLAPICQGKGHVSHMNGLALPTMLQVSILEQVRPGKGVVSIHNADQLQKEVNIDIPLNDRTILDRVIETYPVRLSRHIVRQAMVSKNVACQYLPFKEEMDDAGFDETWVGQFMDGLVERMYDNRVIFLLNMTCPAYCRFCFRKHKDSRNEPNPGCEDVKRAVDYVNASPEIKEILITGGDPFLNRNNLSAAIDGLSQVRHVQTLRLGTRSVAYYPDLFLKNGSEYLTYLKDKNEMLSRVGKRMELATHFIHPDEVSPQSLEIISRLLKNGIAVYIQTPFLGTCNDKGPELVTLFRLLRSAGAHMHYIFMPCHPIHGNRLFKTSISTGIEAAGYLRAHLSDRAMPIFCTPAPMGKIDWFTSGWAVEKVKGKDPYFWLRTPYTPDYFSAFASLKDCPDIRLNTDGTLDIQYMADTGNDNYFSGERPSKTASPHPPAASQEIQPIIESLLMHRQTARSIVDTGVPDLFRLHETRVEIGPDAGAAQLDYIRSDARITDVVISSETDVVTGSSGTDGLHGIVTALQNIDHVTAVRLKSQAFCLVPDTYSENVVNALGDLNHLNEPAPLRLEIEAWFVLPRQVTSAHKNLVQHLNTKGITVYCNVPLLGGVNDNDETIHHLAYEIRSAGMEFHHVYVAGLPIQEKWNRKRPIDSYDVVDIATRVRRDGSGREIPRYVFFTPLEEADYGLTASFVREPAGCSGNACSDDQVTLKLSCYHLSYFRSMDDAFEYPKGIHTDGDCPVVDITGMIKTNDFAIS